MSLIDDALRKAGGQSSRREAPTDWPSSWIRAYGPDRRARRQRMIRRLSLLAALVAGGVALLWLMSRGKPDRALATPRAAARPAVPAPLATSLPKVVVALPPRERPPGRSVVSAPAAALDRAPARHDPGRRTTPTSLPRKPRASPRPPAGFPSPPAAEKLARAAADGNIYRGEVTLPEGGKITLDGIAAYSKTHPVVVLNGRVLEIGGVVEKFVIVSIKPNRVELKGRGRTIFLDLK